MNSSVIERMHQKQGVDTWPRLMALCFSANAVYAANIFGFGAFARSVCYFVE
jgi:hypothetical protein